MYSLAMKEKQDKMQMVEEAQQRRHRVLSKPSPEHRDRTMLGVYGQTRDGMAKSSQSRRGEWMSRAISHPEMSTILQAPPDPSGLFFEHTFRDRQPGNELGPANGAVSAKTYVPRAVYLGGGEIQRAKTASLKARTHGAQIVDMLEPREATASMVDQGKTRGRLKQPPYSNPGYFLRVREQSKELGPPMRYMPKNEMERVHDSLAALTVNDSGEWDEGELFPVWRNVEPHKWKGSRKRLNTAPAPMLTHSMNGDTHEDPLHSSEPYVVHRQSQHAVKDKLEGFRPRQKEGELSGACGVRLFAKGFACRPTSPSCFTRMIAHTQAISRAWSTVTSTPGRNPRSTSITIR